MIYLFDAVSGKPLGDGKPFQHNVTHLLNTANFSHCKHLNILHISLVLIQKVSMLLCNHLPTNKFLACILNFSLFFVAPSFMTVALTVSV